MNAVEIEQAITDLAAAPFDAATFPYAFLAAFGNKETTLKRLKDGGTNKSDLAHAGGLLQSNNIHLQVCPSGQTSAALAALQASPATTRYKAHFVLASEGRNFSAGANFGGRRRFGCASCLLGFAARMRVCSSPIAARMPGASFCGASCFRPASVGSSTLMLKRSA